MSDLTQTEIEEAVRPAIAQAMLDLVDGILPFIECDHDREVLDGVKAGLLRQSAVWSF